MELEEYDFATEEDVPGRQDGASGAEGGGADVARRQDGASGAEGGGADVAGCQDDASEVDGANNVANDGYASDASITTVQGGRARKAYLICEGEGGQARRIAFGECWPDDGVFVVAPYGVFKAGADVDVGDGKLGVMGGGLLSLEELDDAELDLEFIDDEPEQLDAEVIAGAAAERTAAAAVSASAAEMEALRQRANELEDELQYNRDALLEVQEQASADVLMACAGAKDVRVRVEIDDPQSRHKSKLIPLAQMLRECALKRQRPPILTSTERVRKAQRVSGAYKARAEERGAALVDARSETEQVVQQLHKAEQEIEQLRAQLDQKEQELLSASKRVDDVAVWKQIECLRGQKHEAQQLEVAAAAHAKELALRSKRAATWTRKRNNISRTLKRSTVGRDREAARAKAAAAEAQSTAADNTALHAELGESVKISAQRQAAHANAPFTFNNVMRDLKVRQHSLNSGAGNLRLVTGVYSQHVSADGRDLKLESGSLTTVLRWEKRADVVCILIEARRLRQALLDEPLTRVWAYTDLSPDARAIEQAGMGFEYAKVRYISPDGDAPPPFVSGRLSGEPLGSSATVCFGVDGCPITEEHWVRVFTPMLAALGPKYAATADCFMRVLQVYGCTVAELLDPDFRFATVERHDVPVPLIEHIEGFTSDAGGEVHKSGGVIDTVAPKATWNHCASHCGNLALERSESFARVGANVRSLSSFCRGGHKHDVLVLHMKRVQQPELAGDDCDPRLLAIYRDAHAHVKSRGQFHAALGGCTALPAAVGEQMDRLEALVLVAARQLERKCKKGTDVYAPCEPQTRPLQELKPSTERRGLM